MSDPKVVSREVAQEALSQAGLMKLRCGDLKTIIEHATACGLEVSYTGAIIIPGVFDLDGKPAEAAQIVYLQDQATYLVT